MRDCGHSAERFLGGALALGDHRATRQAAANSAAVLAVMISR